MIIFKQAGTPLKPRSRERALQPLTIPSSPFYL
jgi:hypothetical protein